MGGSTWGKWDLQIQPIKYEWLQNTNNPQIANRIENATKDFLSAAKEKQINVVAITDHNCGKAIDYAIADTEFTVLPGVELDMKEGWHLLIIFSPDYKQRMKKDTWSEVVEFFLSNICQIPPPFFNNDNTPKKVEETTTNFLRKIWSENIGIPIFPHCVSNDGFFQRGDDQSRKEILNLFDNDIAWFCFEIKNKLDQIQIIKEKILQLSQKDILIPIISSSDANKASNVGSCYTWIKGDFTYEGFKQIIFESDLRVKIQDDNPSELETYPKFNRLSINFPVELKIKNDTGETNVFCLTGNHNVEFSNNLTCIIGGRGSGKSTLIHLLYNKWANKNIEKLSSINSPLSDLVFDSHPLKEIASLTNISIPHQTEFFFQNEIEENAKDIDSMSKLISYRLKKISKLDENKSLDDYYESWTKSYASFKDLIDAYDNIATIDKKIQDYQEEIDILKTQTNVIQSEEYKEHQKNIELISEKISSFERFTNYHEDLLLKIDALLNFLELSSEQKEIDHELIANFIEQIKKFRTNFQEDYDKKFNAYEAEDFTSELANKRILFKRYLEGKGLSPENVTELTDANLKIKELENDILNYRIEKQPFEKIYHKRDEYLSNLKRLYLDYEDRINEVTILLEEKISVINISEKKISFNSIKNLDSLKSDLVHFIKSNAEKDFSPKTNVLENTLLIDDEIHNYISEKNDIRIKINANDRADKHSEFLQNLLNDDVILEKFYLRLIANYFNVDNIKINTMLGDKHLKNTSFGERCGIVIVILLVAGNNPLIIDQPEDHLDGRYISDVLVPLIRKQKNNRQILIVTRDANIVVGSDSELIHILEVQDEETKIYSGSLENLDYRDKYIWILDGGEKAFIKRERKYDIGKLSTHHS